MRLNTSWFLGFFNKDTDHVIRCGSILSTPLRRTCPERTRWAQHERLIGVSHEAVRRISAYCFGQTGLAVAFAGGKTVSGAPFCHCTISSVAPTRRPLSSNFTLPPG
jgi:hypothetical protein